MINLEESGKLHELRVCGRLVGMVWIDEDGNFDMSIHPMAGDEITIFTESMPKRKLVKSSREYREDFHTIDVKVE